MSEKKSFRVVINALQYKRNSSGIGVMIRELFEPYTQMTRRQGSVILPKDGPTFHAGKTVQTVRIPYDHHQGLRRMLFQTFRVGRRYCKDSVLLITDSKTPLFLPRSCRLVPLITDLAVYRMPQVYQASRVLLWRMQYRYICRRADMFLAISEFTKRDMMDVFHIPEERIRVIPCACPSEIKKPDEGAVDALRKRLNLPKRFVLFVGNNNPRKNLRRMLEAFDLAKDEGTAHHLVIAGEQGWKFSRDEALKGIRHREDVHFIGFVPDADMPALYAAAELFLFPTLYEGFGIPILEAQTCGTPVVTGSVTAMPEVGGAAAVYADPYDPADVCRAMLDILNDDERKENLIRLGYENVKRFSWEASARRLDEIMEEVAKQ